MAARKIENFPTAFERLTRRALSALATTRADGPPLISIPCPTRGAAVNLQMQIRQYWLAVDEAHRSGTSGMYAGLGDIAHRVGVLAIRYNKVDKRVLEVIHRNQMRGASILAATLGALEETLESLDGKDPASRAGPEPGLAPVVVQSADPMSDAIEAAFPGGGDSAPRK